MAEVKISMTTLSAFVLVLALMGQVIAATDDPSALDPPAAKPRSKPCRQSGPVHYGEDPAQALIVNYYPHGPSRAAVVLITGWTAGPFNGKKDTPPLYEDLGLAFVRITHRSVDDFPPPAQLNDSVAGLTYLKKHAAKWNIDPDRLALTGISSGAHLAMLVAFRPGSPRVAAVVEHSAPTDFDPDFMKTINPEMINLPIFAKLFGAAARDWDSDEIKARARELSPVTYMSPDDPPTLFLARRHGPPPADPDPHYGNHHHRFAEHGYSRLKQIGGKAQLFIFEEGPQGKREADAAEAAFLRKHLHLTAEKPAVQPSPDSSTSTPPPSPSKTGSDN